MRVVCRVPHSFLLLHLLCSLEFGLVLVSPLTEKEILLQFKGNISSDPYSALSSWDLNRRPCGDYGGVSCDSLGNVVKIVLWNTSLGGVLSPALSGLKSLRIITLFGNQFTGNIPLEYGDIGTLWKINLSSNALSGSIPEFIGDLSNIRFLDLSRNGYAGEIPPALFRNCYKTRFVSLAHNNLSGEIPSSIGNCVNLEGIDLSFNGLTGEFPAEVCDIPGLQYFSVRSNLLSGSVEEQVLRCRSLNLLDLGSNRFDMSPPFELVRLVNLTYLNISWNGFQGQISELDGCHRNLEVLDASGNNLYGEIPSSITQCSGLRYLDLSFNRLTGSIPIGIGDLKNLLVVILGNNSIEGTISSAFGNIEWLEVLDLHNLRLNGEIPNEITNCKFLLELDVSGNSLIGRIPENLDNMTYLEILDLHRNQFNGSIPFAIGNLSNINYLDFSVNSFSGSIPTTLGNLQNLSYFNVSFNNLSGVIPSNHSIQQFGFSAFFHNPSLCGAPLVDTSSCSSQGSTGTIATTSRLSTSVIVAIVAAALIVTGVCIITIINMKALREDKGILVECTPLASTVEESSMMIGKLVLFSKSLPSKYEDWETGTKALLNKECLIGGGSIGTVYKTTFEGGISIAVKKLETLGGIKNQDEFEHEIGRLGNIKHPNLVIIQGYYWSSSMQLIFFDFVPNGNLYGNLHGLVSARGILSWAERFEIAIGTAKALAYLHHDCKPPILHLNVKSNNIILDENFTPKLSDYGLGKFLHGSYGKVHNAVGYIAPELAQSSRHISDKCDVYGFGVILLELITGRKPVERERGNNEVVILCEFVRGLIERGYTAASECFDPRLRGKLVETEVIQVMKLGLICTSQIPSRRPSMAEVVQILESVRNHH